MKSNMRRMLWILVIVGIILAILFLLSGRSEVHRRYVKWDYYFTYGSSDAVYLQIHWSAFDQDTTLKSQGIIDSVDIYATRREISVEEGSLYQVYMTAVDTSGLISLPSNVVWFEMFRPDSVRNVGVE